LADTIGGCRHCAALRREEIGKEGHSGRQRHGVGDPKDSLTGNEQPDAFRQRCEQQSDTPEHHGSSQHADAVRTIGEQSHRNAEERIGSVKHRRIGKPDLDVGQPQLMLDRLDQQRDHVDVHCREESDGDDYDLRIAGPCEARIGRQVRSGGHALSLERLVVNSGRHGLARPRPIDPPALASAGGRFL
jgi:hypothetical protein